MYRCSRSFLVIIILMYISNIQGKESWKRAIPFNDLFEIDKFDKKFDLSFYCWSRGIGNIDNLFQDVDRGTKISRTDFTGGGCKVFHDFKGACDSFSYFFRISYSIFHDISQLNKKNPICSHVYFNIREKKSSYTFVTGTYKRESTIVYNKSYNITDLQ